MGQSIVQLQNAFIFQNKECILKEVNIDVLPGEFVFLIGKTGTGKSTSTKLGTSGMRVFIPGKEKRTRQTSILNSSLKFFSIFRSNLEIFRLQMFMPYSKKDSQASYSLILWNSNLMPECKKT